MEKIHFLQHYTATIVFYCLKIKGSFLVTVLIQFPFPSVLFSNIKRRAIF